MSFAQDFVSIKNIQDNLIFLKNGGASLVITTSAVNFGLLFETEQISIIESFAGTLNSLSFPIQINILSHRLDVSSYLKTLDKAKDAQTNPKLKELTIHYHKFIESIIKENNVLDKKFYISINASPAELGLLSKNIADTSKKALTLLSPRKDHIIRQLGRLGLRARQLNTVELIKLFYVAYNGLEDTIVTEAPEIPVLPLKTQPAAPVVPQLIPQIPIAPTPIIQPVVLPVAPPSQPLPPTPTRSSPFVVEELNDEQGP